MNKQDNSVYLGNKQGKLTVSLVYLQNKQFIYKTYDLNNSEK